MRVLAIGAHPDDLECHCGGTLARYVAEGHEVVMCHASAGDHGAEGALGARLAAMRTEEARKAAAIAGAEHVTLGLSDGGIRGEDAEQRRAVEELAREAAPDVVITHSAADYHPDHRELHRLVIDGVHLAANARRPTSGPALPQHVPIYFMETDASLRFQPTEWVDITSTIEVKRQMAECHASELDGEYIEQVLARSAYRGFQCGVRYAEGFEPFPVWLRVRPYRVLP
ncbi:MAG: N-acetylglucosamine malate deacetylase 1 [Solirubrobacteraceae bacterium]|jgi:LmbE family N-acetylglucosaminyl deacetylase